jgi:hypothetical protein
MYRVVEVEVTEREAPELTEADVMPMADAAAFIGISIFYLRNLLDQGRLTTVLDEERRTPAGTPRRLVLRTEAEALKQERETEHAREPA